MAGIGVALTMSVVMSGMPMAVSASARAAFVAAASSPAQIERPFGTSAAASGMPDPLWPKDANAGGTAAAGWRGASESWRSAADASSAGLMPASTPPYRPAYPLKASANRRYLVDQRDVPFMIVGDSPQSLIGNLSVSDAAAYMANRASHGINALWINLLCNKYTGCRPDGTTIDGIPPFMVPGDLSTPNPAYFQRADDMINLAAERGMLVMLDPIETGGWLGTLVTNGAAKARAFGEFLGSRYRGRGNIVWLHGNDLQTWRNPVDDAVVQAVAQGIASTDPGHIHTIELDFLTSGSLDDPTWAPLVGLDAAYTYEPTYAQVLKEYNRPAAVPVFMVEANYELERNPHTDGGSTQNLRRQEYWTMLSGATGQLYGNGLIWPFAKGWQEHLDSPGIIQLDHMRRLFGSYKWYDLVPDQDHTVVTSGYGTFWPRSYTLRLAAFWEAWFGPHGRSLWRRLTEALPSMFDSVATDTYATAARTADGTLVMAYLPTIRSVTVDMSKLARPATARWFDPSDGSFTAISDSPIANAGVREFAPPGPNRDGDGDWVLVLECR